MCGSCHRSHPIGSLELELPGRAFFIVIDRRFAQSTYTFFFPFSNAFYGLFTNWKSSIQHDSLLQQSEAEDFHRTALHFKSNQISFIHMAPYHNRLSRSVPCFYKPTVPTESKQRKLARKMQLLYNLDKEK